MYIKQEGDHDADVERVIQDQGPTDHDHDPHGGAGQRIDDRYHGLGELRRAKMRLQVFAGFILVQREIDGFTPHPLHRPDRMNAFRQGAVCNRVGFPRPAEGKTRAGQPDQADDE